METFLQMREFVSSNLQLMIETWGEGQTAFVLLLVSFLGTYIIFGSLHLPLDIWNWPRCLYQMKIQEKSDPVLESSMIKKLFVNLLVNFTFVVSASFSVCRIHTMKCLIITIFSFALL